MSTICVTMIYIYTYKHNSRINPGNLYKDMCRGTSVTTTLCPKQAHKILYKIYYI